MEVQDYTSFKCFVLSISSMFLGLKSSLLFYLLYSTFVHNNALSLPLCAFMMSWIYFGFLNSLFYMLISCFYMLSLRKQWFRDFWNNNIKETGLGKRIENISKYIVSYDITPYVQRINNMLNIVVNYLNQYIVKIPTVGPYIMSFCQAAYNVTNGLISVFEETDPLPPKIEFIEPAESPTQAPSGLFKEPTKEEMEEMMKTFKPPTEEELKEMVNVFVQFENMMKKAQ